MGGGKVTLFFLDVDILRHPDIRVNHCAYALGDRVPDTKCTGGCVGARTGWTRQL
jgi:hypothetical protein